MTVETSRQPDVGADFPSIRGDLRRLCATHDVDVAWVDESRDYEQLLARVRDEFGRLLSLGRSDTANSRRLRDLIGFSSGAAVIHDRAVAPHGLQQRLDRLERENRDLRAALAGEGAALPEGGPVQAPDGLIETFRDLSALTHQINNPLTSLIGRAQLLRMSGASDERTAKAIRVIEESATRVARYVHDLALVVKAGRERHLGEG